MKKTTENTALHILGTQFLSLYAQFLGLTDLNFWCFFNIIQIKQQHLTEYCSPKCHCFCHLMLNAF